MSRAGRAPASATEWLSVMQNGRPHIDWLIPWHPIEDGTPGDGIVSELRREICDRHVLHGVPVRPVGLRQDCDDVLFELLDGSGRLAVVHLTFATHRETDPRRPDTTFLEGWRQFEREMWNDHAEWTFPDMSDHEPTNPPAVVPYASGRLSPRPFRVRALVAGLFLPYVYAAVALVIAGAFTSHRSAFEAFYSLDPAILVLLAAFPLLVWLIQRCQQSRGFIVGVVIGVASFPVLAMIAVGISFSRGV
jgi:hypothetical protein